MIRTRKMTPGVYNKQSRDFQFIGRLYDIVLNSVKTNTDLIYSLPNNEDADTAFLDLLSMTLGFKSIHNYNINQLKSLCSCFAEIIRNKGNMQSIMKACNALIGAEGITDSVYVDFEDYKTGITLYVSQELSDVNLLKDLLNYILPAGLSYNIVKTLKLSGTFNNKPIGITNKIDAKETHTSEVSIIKDTYTSQEVDYGSIITTGDTQHRILDTAGLLINATITDSIKTEATTIDTVAESTEKTTTE